MIFITLKQVSEDMDSRGKGLREKKLRNLISFTDYTINFSLVP
jgi:hypothetical protein